MPTHQIHAVLMQYTLVGPFKLIRSKTNMATYLREFTIIFSEQSFLYRVARALPQICFTILDMVT